MKKNRLNNGNNESCQQHIKGKIVVVSILHCGQEKTYLEGAKINIYRLNGVCPIFVKSCLTDKSGKVIFNNLPEGCYRIIEIVNKNYFQKPKYIKWNEVCISSENTEGSIMIVNKLKQGSKNKFK
ncbi:prealbumin-like fold domain-containing protein [Clostridium sp. YB-6]|uniref:Prealbumin-like fold domain-containing protein n=2 Tax=Clostridium weizhouense TaxID=2859781 RepID=A0ABS7AIY8_9CLOT|nr:prealbumin-like fold domain-containing protein [Clostridium weizhouense]